ncbi:protein-export chaperone SecB [Lachnoanaerobaculum gingivalis]|uniref:protein-export chaperone SecB n=1 Tax=Lachnoanaerobaculum gingivalis TaxID=2490855 RepID=UPI0028D4E674|nr:protein-export chaperone SecB [Lachnoanaerobaculum gingivalis]
MNESKFQFFDPILEKVKFEVCEDFDDDNFEGISIECNTNVIIVGEQDAKVSLNVNIGNGKKNQPFDISIVMSADFNWDNTINEENAKKMLQVNGSAVLLSYIRPIVSSLTGSSRYPSFNIPFVNFTNAN